MVICYLTFGDVIKTLEDPISAIQSPENCHTVVSIVEGIHIYHILLYFKKLTMVDWIHHGATFYMTILCKMYHNGIIYHFVSFFMCGLPGGIDYMMLFMVKIGLMRPLTEKYINTILNAWIRNPGILFYVAIMLTHKSMLQGHHFTFHCLGLCFWNAIFFNNRVLINYSAENVLKSVQK